MRNDRYESTRVKDDAGFELPEGKIPYPTQSDQAPFRLMERYLDIEVMADGREVVRELRSQAIRQLEMLDEMHRDLVRRAQAVIEKTRNNLRLHNIRMFSCKIRNSVYYLYINSNGEFFSILKPEEYLQADPEARFIGAYRLNEDSSWTRLDD